MKTVTLTEFCNHTSGMLTEVESGERMLILKQGKPIAELSPVSVLKKSQPSWKKPALRISTKGPGLSSAILEERTNEDIS